MSVECFVAMNSDWGWEVVISKEMFEDIVSLVFFRKNRSRDNGDIIQPRAGCATPGCETPALYLHNVIRYRIEGLPTTCPSDHL